MSDVVSLAAFWQAYLSLFPCKCFFRNMPVLEVDYISLIYVLALFRKSLFMGPLLFKIKCYFFFFYDVVHQEVFSSYIMLFSCLAILCCCSQLTFSSWNKRCEHVRKHLSVTFRNVLSRYFTQCSFPTCSDEVNGGNYGDVYQNVDIFFLLPFVYL